MRRRLKALAEDVGWALGTLAALALVAAALPAVPLLILGSRLADWWDS